MKMQSYLIFAVAHRHLLHKSGCLHDEGGGKDHLRFHNEKQVPATSDAALKLL